jgi:hypothetical protein
MSTITPEQLIRSNPGIWLETFGKIRDVKGRNVQPVMNILQRRFNALYVSRFLAGKPLRGILVKPRKRGASTVVGGAHYHQLMNFRHEGVIIGDKLDTSDIVFRMMQNYAETDGYRGQWGSDYTSTTEEMKWEHGSVLRQATARGKATVRGLTPQFIHGCVPPGTPVIVEDGRVVAIEDVVVGSRILTHTGATATVIDKIGQENWKGPMIRITPWLGESICFTKGHKIPTRRGIVEAQDVRLDDELCMPIRKIIKKKKQCRLPLGTKRRQNGGRPATGEGSIIRLDEETGFACGYYLAEGSIKYSKGFRIAVSFARHRTEGAFANRAFAALKPFVSSRRISDRKNSLATAETFYGASLAGWMAENFGERDEKVIPDWVFEASEEFCRGLLTGLLAGDGSKGADVSGGYACQKMVFVSTRASLAMQIRDIAASLGYGWASVRSKESGVIYGRNCKKCWRVIWNGAAARSLHDLVTGNKISGGRKWVSKYTTSENAIWIRVRKIETGIEVPFMWDLSVDHDDHTFRTPSFSIGNTEAAHWENPEETMDAALNAIPDSGFNVVLLESTPFGAEGPFFNTWKGGRWPKAEESPGGKLYWKKWESLCPDQPPDASGLSESYFVRIFAAWYEFEDSHIRLTPEQKQEMERTLDAESWYAGEKKLMDLYLTDGPKGPRLGDEVVDCDVWEQLAWRRVTIKTKCRSSVRIFQEEHPDDPHSCFTSSGRQVFDDDALTHIQLLCRKNVDTGNVDDSKERAIWSTTGHDGATIHRWEPPKIGCRYLMSVDLAEGEDQTKGDDPDAHSALVWRDEYLDHNQVLWPIKLAARVRYGNRMPMIPFARLARALSSYYGNCMIIPEMNNSGMAFITALRAMTDKPCPPIWQRKERDPHSGIERAWDGWRTTDRAEYGGVRSTIIWHFHELIRNKKVEICCPHYHSELASFVDKKGRMEAGSGHDDDVISGCIGVYNIGSATTYSLTETQRFIPPEIAALEKLSEHTDGLAMKW